MNELATRPNRFDDPDAAYRLLIDAHRGLGDEASAALNARLVLVLANEIGDTCRLRQVIEIARAAIDPTNGG